MDKSAGIYRITVHRDGKPDAYYIGQAAVFAERRRRHFNALRGGYHRNKRLQRAFVKYGENAVSFEVLLVCEPSSLLLYEQAVLDAYADRPLYNVHRQCVATPLGTRRSLEARAKMSSAHLGVPLSPEHRAKIGAAFKGRKIGSPSDATRAKQSAAAKKRVGRPVSAATREKLRLAHKRRFKQETMT